MKLLSLFWGRSESAPLKPFTTAELESFIQFCVERLAGYRWVDMDFVGAILDEWLRVNELSWTRRDQLAQTIGQHKSWSPDAHMVEKSAFLEAVVLAALDALEAGDVDEQG